MALSLWKIGLSKDTDSSMESFLCRLLNSTIATIAGRVSPPPLLLRALLIQVPAGFVDLRFDVRRFDTRDIRFTTWCDPASFVFVALATMSVAMSSVVSVISVISVVSLKLVLSPELTLLLPPLLESL